LISYLSANSSAMAWSVGFYALAFFFNYPHYMATIYRAYHTREDFHKYRIFTVHITALIVVTLLLSHFWPRALPWIFTLYLCWSPWHYSGQNYGLFMMFARRAGASPSTNVRQAVYFAFLLSYLVLLVNFHTGLSNDPLFVSLGIPAKASSVVILVLGFGFLAFSAYAVPQLAKEVGWKPLLPSLTLLSTQFLWFLLPTALSLMKSWQIPQSRYSTGVLAVMHSAQYLWITSYYARREATAESRTNWRPFAYFAVLIAGGIALFIPGPWLASRLFHFDFGSSFLIFTALVNIHHFILDGAIWKLRDGRIAALLLNSKENLSNTAAEAGSRALAGLRWLVGNSRSARSLRVATALVLLGWAIVDQVRYYYSLQAESLADLKRAAELNSFDSTLQTRLGQKELESGKVEDAVAAWREALRVNPANAAARDQLLQYLTSQQRFDEAYGLTRQSLRYSPKDVNLQVNNGILAKRVGDSAKALESWNRALALDPRQLSARLYVAGELDQQGKAEEAIPQYIAYLQLLPQVALGDRPPATSVISIVLRLAECQTQADHLADAEKSYAMARSIAAETKEAALESQASASEAALKAAQHKNAEALRLYQHALQLDATLNDPRTHAADWYNYGLFLRETGFPARLSYACMMKAEQLMKPLNAPELKLVAAAREELTSKDHTVGALTTKQLEPAIAEALQLQAR
jgi:tetratricopeptide (TPR) repeat protein